MFQPQLTLCANQVRRLRPGYRSTTCARAAAARVLRLALPRPSRLTRRCSPFQRPLALRLSLRLTHRHRKLSNRPSCPPHRPRERLHSLRLNLIAEGLQVLRGFRARMATPSRTECVTQELAKVRGLGRRRGFTLDGPCHAALLCMCGAAWMGCTFNNTAGTTSSDRVLLAISLPPPPPSHTPPNSLSLSTSLSDLTVSNCRPSPLHQQLRDPRGLEHVGLYA